MLSHPPNLGFYYSLLLCRSPVLHPSLRGREVREPYRPHPPAPPIVDTPVNLSRHAGPGGGEGEYPPHPPPPYMSYPQPRPRPAPWQGMVPPAMPAADFLPGRLPHYEQTMVRTFSI